MNVFFYCKIPWGKVPTLLFGRLVSRSAWVTSRVAHPTVYAVLGAGAALGGWTRMGRVAYSFA